MKAFCNYFSYISIVIIIVTAAFVKRISEIFNYFSMWCWNKSWRKR